MVDCNLLTEKKIRIFVRSYPDSLPINGVAVRYGHIQSVSDETLYTNEFGFVEFCYPRFSNVYVSLQKTNYVLSRYISGLPKPPKMLDVKLEEEYRSWGGSSDWYKASSFGVNSFYGVEKPIELPLPVEPPIEVPPVEEIIEEVIDIICQTEATPTVPATLSSYFPISIRDARWICNGIPENITNKNAIIKIDGVEIAQIMIRNGYASPLNLGTVPEFRDLLAELVG